MKNSNMEYVLAELSKIETAAEKMQLESDREKEEYAKLMEDKIREFDEKLIKETDENLANLKDSLEQKKKEELSAMREDILKQTSKIEKTYEENADKWVKDIVDNIIKE